jgi:tryptophan-rich sensory protein
MMGALMARYLPLVLFVLLVAGGGSLIGANNIPGEWYENLNKPAFNPPNWIFGPVWTVLYVMIGIAGWRIWRMRRTGGAMTAWWVQLGLNFLWSPVFFTLQNIGLALVIIVGMLASIITFIVLAWRQDRAAALLFIPYLAWVAFATLLNASIFYLN